MASIVQANKVPFVVAADKAEDFKKFCKESKQFEKAMERAERNCPGFAKRRSEKK